MKTKVLFTLFLCFFYQTSFAHNLIKNEKIYVIAKKSDWLQSRDSGVFITPSLYEEGFIHASTKDQLLLVLNTYYKGAKQLVILEMFINNISSRVEFEYIEQWGQSFPHIFGHINVNEVHATYEISSSEDGSYSQIPCLTQEL